VLGAGLAGLSASYHLGGDAPIYEASDRVGGLCSSRQIDGFTFDHTGHLLHFRVPYTRDLVSKLLEQPLLYHHRKSWVYTQGNWIKYPFQANLHDLPAKIREECVDEFLAVQGSHARSQNFEEWILNHFGKGIARHFMIPYNEKLWRFPLDRMSCSWIDCLIPQPDPEEVLKGASGPAPRDYGYNIQFGYPETGGIGRLAEAFVPHVGPIQFQSRAIRIDPLQRTVFFEDGTSTVYRSLVSTMPLPVLLKLLDPIPERIVQHGKNLIWNSIINLNLGIDRANITDKHWIYFPDQEQSFYRVGFPANFSPDSVPPGKSSMYVEVSYRGQNLHPPDELTHRVVEELIQVGLLRSHEEVILSEYNDIKHAYVIYDLNYRQVTRETHEYLESQGIFSIGRFGRWRYYSMEQTMLDGRDSAERVLRMHGLPSRPYMKAYED